MGKRWSVLVLGIGLAVACNKDNGKGGGGSYARTAKVSEARLMLNKLNKHMKAAAIEAGKLPSVTAPPTPSKPCCSYPDQTCPPDPAAWQAEPWASLGFQIDEPHRFQYDVTSDDTTYTAHAVGDMSCKGDVVTLTMRGTLDPATYEVKTELDDPTDTKAR